MSSSKAQELKLSPNESRIFAILQHGMPVGIDRMVELIDSASKKDVSAKAITATMKMMAQKLATQGYRIRMIEGGRGRGKKGVYKLERIK